MTSLRAVTARSAAWTAAQVVVTRGMTTAAFILISRQLTPTEFGVVALALGFIALLQVLGDSGVSSYIVRQTEVDESLISTTFWCSLILNTLLAVVLALLAPLIESALDADGLALIVAVLASSLVLTGLTSVPSSLMRRAMHFKQLAVRDTIAMLAGSTVAIVLALMGAGAWALVAQWLLRSVVSLVIMWVAVSWRPSRVFSIATSRDITKYHAKAVSIDLMGQARGRGEELVIVGVMGAASLGLWSVANKLGRLIVDSTNSVIAMVAQPAFTQVQSDPARLSSAFGRSLSVTSAVSVPALLGLAVVTPDLVPLLLGQQWAAAVPVAQVVAVMLAVMTLESLDRTVYIATNRQGPELVLSVAFTVLHVAVVLVSVHWGLFAMAAALLVKTLIQTPVRLLVLRSVAHFPWRTYAETLRIVAAAAGMALIAQSVSVWGVQPGPVRLVVMVGIAAVTYPLLLFVLARPTVTTLTAELRRR